MKSSLEYHPSPEGSAMLIVSESAAALKGFLAQTGWNELARTMMLRVALAFTNERRRTT